MASVCRLASSMNPPSQLRVFSLRVFAEYPYSCIGREGGERGEGGRGGMVTPTGNPLWQCLLVYPTPANSLSTTHKDGKGHNERVQFSRHMKERRRL